MTLRWVGSNLIDIEENATISDSWKRQGKLFDVGDKVKILDGSNTKEIVGYEWEPEFAKYIGKIRTIEQRVINYYGYIVGYRLKNVPGIWSPDFLTRSTRKKRKVKSKTKTTQI